MIKVYPVPGAPVREPGNSIPTAGQPVRRVGMTYDYDKKDYVPRGKAFECDETHPEACLVMKALRQGALLPADKDTAAMAGVPFVELEIGKDGWVAPVAGKTAKKGDA